MHLGLIVGIGPAATDYYYRGLIAAAARDGVDLQLTMAHADLGALARNTSAADQAAQVALYLPLLERLKRAGVERAAITSIGGSFCMEQLLPISPLPLIDIIDVIDTHLAERPEKTFGVIGTKLAMGTKLYGRLARHRIVAPEGTDAETVGAAYMAIATRGAASAAEREVCFAACRKMATEQGVEAVMLGGTDLFLAFDGTADPGVAVIDCAALHIQALAKAASE